MSNKKDVCDIFFCDPKIVDRQKEAVKKTEGLASIFKLLSDDTRLKIVYALSQEKELCVCEIATIIGSSIATASHHLRLLRNMGVAKYRREGKLAYYSLKDHDISQIINNALKLQEKEAILNEKRE